MIMIIATEFISTRFKKWKASFIALPEGSVFLLLFHVDNLIDEGLFGFLDVSRSTGYLK